MYMERKVIISIGAKGYSDAINLLILDYVYMVKRIHFVDMGTNNEDVRVLKINTSGAIDVVSPAVEGLDL